MCKEREEKVESEADAAAIVSCLVPMAKYSGRNVIFLSFNFQVVRWAEFRTS